MASRIAKLQVLFQLTGPFFACLFENSNQFPADMSHAELMLTAQSHVVAQKVRNQTTTVLKQVLDGLTTTLSVTKKVGSKFHASLIAARQSNVFLLRLSVS